MSESELELLHLRLLLNRHVIPQDSIYEMAKQAVEDRAVFLAERNELRRENERLRLQREIFERERVPESKGGE